MEETITAVKPKKIPGVYTKDDLIGIKACELAELIKTPQAQEDIKKAGSISAWIRNIVVERYKPTSAPSISASNPAV